MRTSQLLASALWLTSAPILAIAQQEDPGPSQEVLEEDRDSVMADINANPNKEITWPEGLPAPEVRVANLPDGARMNIRATRKDNIIINEKEGLVITVDWEQFYSDYREQLDTWDANHPEEANGLYSTYGRELLRIDFYHELLHAIEDGQCPGGTQPPSGNPECKDKYSQHHLAIDYETMLRICELLESGDVDGGRKAALCMFLQKLVDKWSDPPNPTPGKKTPSDRVNDACNSVCSPPTTLRRPECAETCTCSPNQIITLTEACLAACSE